MIFNLFGSAAPMVQGLFGLFVCVFLASLTVRLALNTGRFIFDKLGIGD